MADLDNEVEDLDLEYSESTDTYSEPDEITYDEAMKWKKDSESLEKAVNNYVKPSKELLKKFGVKNFKELSEMADRLSQEKTGLNEEKVKEMFKREKFFEKNPNAEAYREKMAEYEKTGLSLDEAYLLASKNDAEIDRNRNIY